MLRGKVALVTGSTSGIGLAIAQALAGQGADLVLNGFGEPAGIEAIRSDLETRHGVRAVHVAADMAKPDEIAALVSAAESRLGRLDILVNNAGIQHTAPVERFPAEKWEQVIAVNLSACFYSIRAALPGMRARGWGRIVNIASVHGLVASVDKSASSRATPSRSARASICFSTRGVSTHPGQIALQVIALRAVSSATVLVRPIKPCLAAT